MKIVKIILIIAVLVAVIVWYLSGVRANESGIWRTHLQFIDKCTPNNCQISIWKDGTLKKQFTKKEVSRVLKKLSEIKIANTDSPIYGDYDVRLEIIRDGKYHRNIEGWSDKTPTFSIRARSDIGPWLSRFVKP